MNVLAKGCSYHLCHILCCRLYISREFLNIYHAQMKLHAFADIVDKAIECIGWNCVQVLELRSSLPKWLTVVSLNHLCDHYVIISVFVLTIRTWLMFLYNDVGHPMPWAVVHTWLMGLSNCCVGAYFVTTYSAAFDLWTMSSVSLRTPFLSRGTCHSIGRWMCRIIVRWT